MNALFSPAPSRQTPAANQEAELTPGSLEGEALLNLKQSQQNTLNRKLDKLRRKREARAELEQAAARVGLTLSDIAALLND